MLEAEKCSSVTKVIKYRVNVDGHTHKDKLVIPPGYLTQEAIQFGNESISKNILSFITKTLLD